MPTKFSRLLTGGPVELLYRHKLTKVVRENFERMQAERRHRLHASLVDSDPFCLRAALLNVVADVDSRHIPTSRLWIFEDGNWRHRRWQSLLQQAGLVVSDDVEKTRFLPGLWSLCTPDAIIQINDEKYIWECKGMNEREYRSVERLGVCPKRFVRRVHVYGAATGLTKAIVHIDNKSRSDEFMVFLIDLDHDLIVEMMRRIERLERAYQRYRETRELPRPCGRSDCSCSNTSSGLTSGRKMLGSSRKN